MATAESPLQKNMDADGHYLTAEVAFVIREEFALTLCDIVFRRMMTGLHADQGRSLYDAIASIAAAEMRWSPDELHAEVRELVSYADSLRVTD
jgi:glycerol-3-phosphate dehydrogenase